VTGGASLLVFTFIQAEHVGWASQTVVSLATALGLLGAFVLIERRCAEPLLPFTIFRSRSLSVANAGMILFAAGGQFTVVGMTTSAPGGARQGPSGLLGDGDPSLHLPLEPPNGPDGRQHLQRSTARHVRKTRLVGVAGGAAAEGDHGPVDLGW